ncbi:MAG: hypothetical protein WD315_01650 [Balneolaceae bacterium]
MNALNRYAHTAHWFLRLIFISVFLYHGLDKFGNLSGFADMANMPVAMTTETHPMGGMQFQVTLLFGVTYLFLKGNLINAGEGVNHREA